MDSKSSDRSAGDGILRPRFSWLLWIEHMEFATKFSLKQYVFDPAVAGIFAVHVNEWRGDKYEPSSKICC